MINLRAFEIATNGDNDQRSQWVLDNEAALRAMFAVWTPRMRALAQVEAERQHDDALEKAGTHDWLALGHEHGIETCPHPDCVLVRRAVEDHSACEAVGKPSDLQSGDLFA